MTRAVRTPPSTLTAWAPASRRKRPALSSASSTVAYDMNGMSPMTSDRPAPRTTALVWWSMSSMDTRTVDS